jgi:hypothetical protein
MSSSRGLPEADPEQLAQLAVTLSRRLARVLLEDMGPTIAEALSQIAAAIRVDRCQLLELAESGSVTRAHVPTGTATAPEGQDQTLAEAWLVERLVRNELVDISRPDELPREAIASRDQARRTGACSILAVPASVGGQVVCAW